MSYKVLSTPTFQKDTKRLLKKYPSLKSDLLLLVQSLETQPIQGIPLGNNLYKIRLSISSTGKGKSGGARVISLVKVIREEVFLVTIYTKSERSSISKDDLERMLSDLS